jgi:hypothetical protein
MIATSVRRSFMISVHFSIRRVAMDVLSMMFSIAKINCLAEQFYNLSSNLLKHIAFRACAYGRKSRDRI